MKNAGIPSSWNDIMHNPQCTHSKHFCLIKIIGT